MTRQLPHSPDRENRTSRFFQQDFGRPSNSVLSFLDATFRAIYPQDVSYRQQAEERLSQLTMPHWALGDLMDLAVDLAGMTRSLTPPISRKKL